MIQFDHDDDALFAQLDADLAVPAQQVQAALDALGIEIVAWLQSLTAEMRPPPGSRLVVSAAGRQYLYTPPRYAGEGDREAHPGHWADVTGTLAAAYGHDVQMAGAGVWMLELVNSSAYAEALEARDAYWVLDPVFDQPEVLALLDKHLNPLAS